MIAPDIILTREYMMLMRQALLMQLDAIEKLLGVSPRTSELRKEARAVAYEKQHEEIKI